MTGRTTTILKGWQKITLGEIVTLNYGKGLVGSSRSSGSVPVFGSSGITGWHNEALINGPGIIIGRKGTVGSLYKSLVPFYPIDTVYYIKKDDLSCDFDYLFYLLKTLKLSSLNSDSAVPGLNRDNAYAQRFSLPPLQTQRAIANVLSSSDDKIELLREENKTLENIAQTIFKEWFVKDENDLPEGWRVGKLEDLCIKLNSGGTPLTSSEEYYNGDIDWYSTKELQDNFLFQSDKRITRTGLDNSSAKLFPPRTVLMAIYAAPTVGRLGILTGEATFNQAACGFVANENVCCNEYIYLLLKNLRGDFNSLSNGAAQQNISVGLIKNFPVCIPKFSTMKTFKDVIQPIFNKMLNNSVQIQTLSKLRDTLLPKLISGEVEV